MILAYHGYTTNNGHIVILGLDIEKEPIPDGTEMIISVLPDGFVSEKWKEQTKFECETRLKIEYK